MTQVARYYGQPFMAVWHAPYHETLFAFAGMVQRQRIDALTDHARDLKASFRVNAAFANPKALETENRELLSTLRRPAGVPDIRRMTKDDAAKMAAQILTEAGMAPKPETTNGD